MLCPDSLGQILHHTIDFYKLVKYGMSIVKTINKQLELLNLLKQTTLFFTNDLNFGSHCEGVHEKIFYIIYQKLHIYKL